MSNTSTFLSTSKLSCYLVILYSFIARFYLKIMTSAQPNPFLLAADNSPQLLPLLRTNPALASSQDEHGYSLVHAAASYNHLDLLRTLINEFHVNVDLKDEDNETALFVVETVDAVKVLVEELHADVNVRGDEGATAREKIEAEGDFPEVAAYLISRELGVHANGITNGEASQSNGTHPPPVPEGLQVNVGTMAADEIPEDVVDDELRRRIQELASRADFEGEEGQQELRDLITEALHGSAGAERDVRQRTE